jgi:hypothetical protein
MSIIQKFLVKLVSSGFINVTLPNFNLGFLNNQNPSINSRAFHLLRLINNLENQYKPLLPHLLPTLIESSSYDDFRRQIVCVDDLDYYSVRQFLMEFDALLLQIHFSSPTVISRFLPSPRLLSDYISDSSQIDQELYNAILTVS